MRLADYPMTTAEAAHYLDYSLGHLYNLLSRGEGPAHVRYAGRLRFARADLDAWAAARMELCLTHAEEMHTAGGGTRTLT